MLRRFDRPFTKNMSTPEGNATSMQNFDTSVGLLSLDETATADITHISKIEALDYKCASTSTSQASTNSISPLKTSSPSSSNISSDSTSRAATSTYQYAPIVRQDDEDDSPLIMNRTRVVENKKIHGQALFEHTRVSFGYIERPRTRLLILEPGSGEDPIRCSLDQYRLDRAPEFEALSYVWGDGPKDWEVHVSDKMLLVSQNLHTALSHLRYPDQTRVLWADAICINQQDTDEKAKQVQLMGQIYETAKTVIVWLGPEDPRDCRAFELVRAVENRVRGTTSRTSKENLDILEALEADRNIPADGWAHLGVLFSRPYFKRLWVIQEVAKARCATVLCGNESISYEALFAAHSYCVQAQDLYVQRAAPQAGIPSLEILLENNNMMLTYSCSKSQKNKYTFFDLLYATSSLSTGEPRDRLFALLGLSLVPYEWVPRPDYKSSVSEVLRRFTILDLLHNNSLRAMSWSCIGPGTTSSPSLRPSWVPDISNLRSAPVITFAQYARKQRSGGNTAVAPSIDEDQRILTIKGRQVSQINSLGIPRRVLYDINSRATPTTPADFEDAVVMAIEQNWMNICLQLFFAADNCDTREAMAQLMQSEIYNDFIRALCCDWNPVDQTSPTTHVISLMRLAVADLVTGQNNWDEGDAYRLLIAQGLTYRSRLCFLEDGYVGWAPAEAEVGDVVCVLNGSVAPFALRAIQDGTFLFVGECYVHGLMNGEILHLGKEERDFVIQ